MFDPEKEMVVRYRVPGKGPRLEMPVFNAPITAAENFLRAVRTKDPLFLPDYRHFQGFGISIFPDVEARGFIMDGSKPRFHPEGFPDMFGVRWMYSPDIGGSMVVPGKPKLSCIAQWRDLEWPNIDSWDWEGQQQISKDYIKNPELLIKPTIFTGYFERLISLLDFENAAMALIDEDEQEEVHAFLDKLSDLYCAIIDKYSQYFGIQALCVHDDWGSQRAPFFSLNTAREMLVPYIKKVTDHAHSRGIIYDMHCCGKIESVFPAMAEAGIDVWSGQHMNDKEMLYQAYGDKVLIGVETPNITAEMSKDEVDAIAREYAKGHMVPGRPALIDFHSPIANPYFFEAIYREARLLADR